MMRSSPASSMQKTYDQCYIICSTAVYFEKQNNEEEALRSWREALDQIYYNNAFRIPASYKARNETEKALQESLREMEMQCKERVDLLEALKKSRDDAGKTSDESNGVLKSRTRSRSSSKPSPKPSTSKLGDGTIPPVNYPDLARPSLPQRRSASGPGVNLGQPQARNASAPEPPPRPTSAISPPGLGLGPGPGPGPDFPPKLQSRTPSPEKKGGLFKSTLRPQRPDSSRNSTSKLQMTMRSKPQQPAAGKAATMAWPNLSQTQLSMPGGEASSATLQSTKLSPTYNQARSPSPRPSANHNTDPQIILNKASPPPAPPPPPPPPPHRDLHRNARRQPERQAPEASVSNSSNGVRRDNPSFPLEGSENPATKQAKHTSLPKSEPLKMPDFPTYRREYGTTGNGIDAKKAQAIAAMAHGNRSDARSDHASPARRQKSPNRRKAPGILRKAVPAILDAQSPSDLSSADSSEGGTDKVANKARRRRATSDAQEAVADSGGDETNMRSPESRAWDSKAEHLMKNLPKGIDMQAAKSILNEIVIKGDHVTWDDVAGLDIAKSALKEAVVYPFLRPDLFKGLREPARGMLLFGPPGTGKTMLARAVATMSKSTFFSISASSLTSKFLGESEKLVRALFAIAKALAPSIIFVDEIDSLLSSRSGSGEHEATRRIKTEFLIQWSDLQKAAAGREEKDKSIGDATRVLVLAATNMPWAIDEAARRRFVRRQYIPLPEPSVRKDQLRRLMERQKNSLKDSDYEVLVHLTDGFSGSDITALAKDAAMGPLRSLGEMLLDMSPEDIRPIGMQDFEASLVNIRPSVSTQGLKDYEDWAKEFGERGG
ncbi:MAG: hypothetical protein Q9159_005806 [Coniocarpon cinnabarinum]